LPSVGLRQPVGPRRLRSYTMLINQKEIHVEWGDCDPAGIVYFPRYFEYGDSCTLALFEKAGLFKPALLENFGIAGIPMVEVRAQYFVPSQYGDTMIVESCIDQWGRTTFNVHHKFHKGNMVAVELFEKRAWVARISALPARFKSQPIPEEIKQLFWGDLHRPAAAVIG